MPISRRYSCGDVQIAVWAIEETSQQLGKMLGDDAMLLCVHSYGSESRKAEWLAVRLLLREVVGSDTRIEYEANGKPLLVGDCGYISISHTRGFAVLAYSPKRPFGLDVELATRKVGVARSYIMSDSEQLSAMSHGDSDAYLLLRWTTCEAMYKLTGVADYKENLSMPVFVPDDSGVFDVSCLSCVSQPYVGSYMFDEGLLLTVCVAGCDASRMVRL